jgi:hypothetical protein
MLLDAMVLSIWDVVSAGLALIIAYFMSKSFRVVRTEYLLGFPVGFSSLAVGYLASGVSHMFRTFEEPASWVHLFLVTFGFAFIAGSYFLRKRNVWKSAPGASTWVFSLLVTMVVAIVVVIMVPPRFLFPPYRSLDEGFQTANVVLLLYILLSLYLGLREERHEFGSMVLAGFSLLASSHYTMLLWALDDGFWSLLLGHALGLLGLVALATSVARGFRKG